jgi:hypothetical protein
LKKVHTKTGFNSENIQSGHSVVRSKLVARRSTRSRTWPAVLLLLQLTNFVSAQTANERPITDGTSWTRLPRTPSRWRPPFRGISTLSQCFKHQFQPVRRDDVTDLTDFHGFENVVNAILDLTLGLEGKKVVWSLLGNSTK